VHKLTMIEVLRCGNNIVEKDGRLTTYYSGMRRDIHRGSFNALLRNKKYVEVPTRRGRRYRKATVGLIVKKIICDALGVDSVTRSDILSDLGMDNIDVLFLVMDIGKQFDIKLDDYEPITVGNLIDKVKETNE